MCTRFYLDSEREELLQLAQLSENGEFGALLEWGDVRPTDVMPILVEKGFHTAAVLGMWGYPNEGGQTTYVNARVETVLMQRAFAADFLARRCVIPVCGYYGEGAKKKQGEGLYFDKKGELLYIAGIWQKNCRGMYRFVVLTTTRIFLFFLMMVPQTIAVKKSPPFHPLYRCSLVRCVS